MVDRNRHFRLDREVSRMRMKTFSTLLCLGVMLAAGGASGEERWEYLGDVTATESRPRGKLSINLDSLRRRAGRYEIWERIEFEPDPRRRQSPPTDEAVAEHRTLWAIRCRAGEMAKVTEGDAGSFDPRADTLKFYSPGPYSAGAAVIETACGEARRLAAEKRPPASALPSDTPPPEKSLEQPPAISDLDQLDADDE
jgi:hypothetical protein